MLTLHELEQHFSYLDPALLEIILELRNLVAELVPKATERILRSGLSYHDAARGGPVKAGICGILIESNTIRLTFNLGAFLPDPAGLLQSDEGRLAKRFVTIRSYADAPWTELRDLIAASSVLDPCMLTEEEIEKVRRQSHTP
jgi:hypothetical protein